jgi:hypothetical protein
MNLFVVLLSSVLEFELKWSGKFSIMAQLHGGATTGDNGQLDSIMCRWLIFCCFYTPFRCGTSQCVFLCALLALFMTALGT